MLAVQSLSHWTTKEVPLDLFSLAKIRYADGNSGHEGSRLYSHVRRVTTHHTGPHGEALKSIRRQREQGESMGENAYYSDFCGQKKKIDKGG